MPALRNGSKAWRVLITAGALVGVYISHRAHARALARLSAKVDKLADRVHVDYWRLYADVQHDMLIPTGDDDVPSP